MQKDLAIYCTNSAKQAITSSSKRRNSNVSKGVPPGPDDTVYATGGEGCASPGYLSGYDGTGTLSTTVL